jgi:anthranilate phosphoribosyltransferase|tara:strand:+ start:269 stop:1294 length:1026 start_codon:yes stop_codon:yes gene_type:complete
MNNSDKFKALLIEITDGRNLNYIQAKLAFEIIMSGEATDSQIGSFLTAVKMQGNNTTIISAGAEIMREKCVKVKSLEGSIDVVGTGGDNLGTLNISTAVSFVLAGANISIAKHGNYSATSKSGAANVLKSLSVNIDCDIRVVELCLVKCGICFLLAPKHHIAMKYVGKIRKELGIRTIFNLLGPLSNPAFVKKQLLGVYDRSLILPFAKSLKKLGSTNAWVVHGHDGLDEVTITGKTYCAQLKDGLINEFIIHPSDIDMPTSPISELIGGEPEENAKEIKELLNGKKSAFRNVVVLNSAAALVATGNADSLEEGAEKSILSIDTGQAMKKLEMLIDISNNS